MIGNAISTATRQLASIATTIGRMIRRMIM